MPNPARLKLLRDLVILSGGQLFSKLVGFLAFAYLARALDPESYGAVEYAVGLAIIFSMIIECGLGPIGVREISRTPQKVAGLAAQIPGARLILALAAAPVMGLVAILSGQPEQTVKLVWIFALGLLAWPWNQDWLLQGREMMKAAAAAQAIRMAVFAAGAVVLVQDSGDLMLVGIVELAAIAIWAAYYLVVQQCWITPVRLRISVVEFVGLIREGISIGLSGLVWAIIQYVPLFLVASLVGGAEIAWFAASHRLVVSLLTFSYVYHFNLYPAIARRAGESPEALQSLVGASFRVVAWGSILLGLALTLLAEPVVVLVFGDRFATAAPAFAVLIWALPATLLSGHARWALVATGRQRYVLIAHVAGAVAMLVTGLALIPAFHSIGAAIAMVAASLTVWAAADRFARTEVGALPALTVLVPPGAVAVASGFAAQAAVTSPWAAGAIAAGAYAVSAPIVDRKLFADLLRLVHAKADVTPASEPTP